MAMDYMVDKLGSTGDFSMGLSASKPCQLLLDSTIPSFSAVVTSLTHLPRFFSKTKNAKIDTPVLALTANLWIGLRNFPKYATFTPAG